MPDPSGAAGSSRARAVGADCPTSGVGCLAWVVGLGSPVGDDRAGWDAVERLRAALPPGARADTTSDPLVVLDAPPGCGILIVIDACRGAGPPGSVHRFEWPDPRLTADGAASSHGLGLAAALALADALGRLPLRVVVLAVEAEPGEPGAGLTPAVEAALPELTARALVELAVGPGSSPRRP